MFLLVSCSNIFPNLLGLCRVKAKNDNKNIYNKKMCRASKPFPFINYAQTVLISPVELVRFEILRVVVLQHELAVFMLQTCNASGRLWASHFSASFSLSFNSSRTMTGERRIIRLDELNRLVRLHRHTKQFRSFRRIMRLHV